MMEAPAPWREWRVRLVQRKRKEPQENKKRGSAYGGTWMNCTGVGLARLRRRAVAIDAKNEYSQRYNPVDSGCQFCPLFFAQRQFGTDRPEAGFTCIVGRTDERNTLRFDPADHLVRIDDSA